MDSDESVYGKREIVDPEVEFIPGETIIKLYYWKRIDGYVTIPGDSLFKVGGGRVHARTCWLRLSLTNSPSKENIATGVHPGEGRAGRTMALRRTIELVVNNTSQG